MNEQTLKNLKASTYFSIILRDVISSASPENWPNGHSEYEIQQIYHEARAEEILEAAGINPTKEALKTVRDKIIASFTQIFYPDSACITLPEIATGDETRGTYYRITFWKPKGQDPLHMFNPFLYELGAYMYEVIRLAGVDDDFFDYAPSEVDMFRQACEIFGQSELYNKWVSGIDDEMFIEDALYVKSLKTNKI